VKDLKIQKENRSKNAEKNKIYLKASIKWLKLSLPMQPKAINKEIVFNKTSLK